MKALKSTLAAPSVPPVQAALTALVVAIGNAAVAFGVLGTSEATVIENVAVDAIAAAFVLVNAVHAKAA